MIFRLLAQNDHYGIKVAALETHLLNHGSEELVVSSLEAHPKNPTVVASCLSYLGRKHPSRFFSIALAYLEPEAAFSDVIRMAVARAIPVVSRLTFASFLTLRLALTDDDEDVREEALNKVGPLLGSTSLSLRPPLRPSTPSPMPNWGPSTRSGNPMPSSRQATSPSPMTLGSSPPNPSISSSIPFGSHKSFKSLYSSIKEMIRTCLSLCLAVLLHY